MTSQAPPFHKEQDVSLAGPSHKFMRQFTKSYLILFMICLTTILSACSSDMQSTQAGPGYGILLGTIVEKESNDPIPARVYATGTNDSIYMAEECIEFDTPWMRSRIGHSGRHFNTIGNSFVVSLPEGVATIRIERGKEYLPLEQEVRIKAGDTISVNFEMDRWIDMNQLGWFSGDQHIHRKMSDIEALLGSEDMNVAVVLSNWNDRASFLENSLPYIKSADLQGVISIDKSHLIYTLAHEIEGDPGAVFYYPLNKNDFPLEGMNRHQDSKHYITLSQETKKNGGFVEIEKPIMTEAPIQAALSDVDFLGIANNHMLYDGYLPEGKRINRTSLRDDYPEGELGYTLFTFDLYYMYLNAGFRLMPTAGSASFPIPNPFGYNRIYANIEGTLSIENWFKAIKTGRSFVTNGPMLITSVNNHPKENEIICNDEDQIDLTCKIYSASPIERLEIVKNGELISTINNIELVDNQALINTEVSIEESCWIVTRCFESRDDKNVRFAHSSPIFFKVKEQPFKLNQKSINWFIDQTSELIKQAESDTTLTRSLKIQKRELYQQAKEFYIKLAALKYVDFK